MPSLFAAQKAMYFFEKLNPNTTTYHHTVAMAISGDLDEKKFAEAVNQLMLRHDALRSYVEENNNGIFLKTLPTLSTLPIELIDTKSARKKLSSLNPDVRNLYHTLKGLKKESVINDAFNLQNGPLWRGALVKLANNEYQLLFVFHHLIVDIGSQNTIMRDLSEIYNALVENRQPILPPIAELKDIHLKQENKEAKLNYWKDKLSDLTTLSLQADYPPQHGFHFIGDRIYFHLNEPTVNALKKLAVQFNCSLNTVLLASMYAMLYRYTSETDLCIGIASANRRGYTQQVDDIVNCFVNSVPMRLSLDKNCMFPDLLKDVTQCLKEALENQLPLNEVIANALSAEVKSSSNVATPFNILCNFNKEKIALDLRNIKTSNPIELNLGHTKFENFGINFDFTEEGCDGFLEFNLERFQKQTMQSFVAHLELFWKKIVENPLYRIADVPILTQDEINLLDNIHDTETYTPNDFFHLFLSRLSKQSPRKTAIVFHGENDTTTKLSYGEFDRITNELAAYLINLGVGPEKTVGVSITRSINLLVAIVAILKAGGVVVPLETSIDSMSFQNSFLYHKLNDSLIDITLVDNKTESLFHSYKKRNRSFYALNIEDKTYQHICKSLDLKYVDPKLTANNLAYIMYTSGTTGIPKGVMIEHGTLNNLIYSMPNRKLPIGSKVLCTAPPTFDCFIFELIEGWLGARGEIHLIHEKERLSPSKLESTIKNFHINCATLLPDIIKNMDPSTLTSLVDVICMGATPTKEILEAWLRYNIIIRNEYGPTEATICTTVNRYKKGKSHSNIGKPIQNMKIFILDENLRECPIGVPGEMYICGGLARGYVGKPELTSQKFPMMFFNSNDHSFTKIDEMEIEPTTVPINSNHKRGRSEENLLSNSQPIKKIKFSKPQTTSRNVMRLYKTGDIGCYAKDGSIIFLGRSDRQIKIHGIRIELEGVESLLQKHPLVKTVVVMPNETKDALVAYIVAKIDTPIAKDDIDNYLAETSLPLVAWPKIVMQLNEMPLNKNGKIDFKALPKPQESKQTITPPQTELQAFLCEMWGKVLKIEQVDVIKTFRQQGGDSLFLATLETMLNFEFPSFSKVSTSVLNRDINIIQLEAAIKSCQIMVQQSKPASLSNTNGTLFGGGKGNTLAFQRNPLFATPPDVQFPIVRNKF